MSFLKNIFELRKNRFILFLLFCLVFVISNHYFTGDWLPSTEMKDLWFYVGLFMVVFSILFIEPYYTSPKNVITNSIPLLLVFLSIQNDFENDLLWLVVLTVLILLIVFSVISITFTDENKSDDHWKNKFSKFIKNIVVILGKGKIIYSATFILFLYLNVTSTALDKIFDLQFVFLLVIWGAVLAIDPKQVNNTFSFFHKSKNADEIGVVFGVQSKKMFLVRLHEDRKSIKKFDVVKYRYSMQDSNEYIMSGIVFDTYLLNKEKWAKVLQLGQIEENLKGLDNNVVYKITDHDERESLEKKLNVKNFVGVITKGSEIGVIKFEYSKKKDNLQEGDLLELKTRGRTLFYQVLNGETKKEKLENRNEMGFVEGLATQLGEWQYEKLSFQKFGWVPEINTPIFKADTSKINPPSLQYPEYQLGIIPGTTLPSVINLNDAVSHHMALIGITGSGKSFLAREMIDHIQEDTKVVCVDFNKEFVTELSPAPENIICKKKAQEIAKKIDWINNELEKFGNKQDKQQIETKQKEIKETIKGELEDFLDNTTNNIKVFELPDVSNTTGILDYTKYFFKVLFEVSKERQMSDQPAKICVVLEEAHTIIPEWNFSGSSDKMSQSLVNSIGQIALQGRKYGVGFVVIAQRTANVSKTVLTQCNTVVCFQAFDKTSFSFLENYVGKDLVQSLPNLREYHAIVTGKAIRSNLPMIVDLRRSENN